jgi:hypothetical protein
VHLFTGDAGKPEQATSRQATMVTMKQRIGSFSLGTTHRLYALPLDQLGSAAKALPRPWKAQRF